MADLQRLRTEPNRRCQVPNTMRATLPLILNDTCISDIATKMADVMFPTAVELAPRSKRPRGAQGWRAGPGGEVEKDEAWKQIKGARRRLRADPHSRNIRKTVEMAGKNLWKIREAAVLIVFCTFVRKLETRV